MVHAYGNRHYYAIAGGLNVCATIEVPKIKTRFSAERVLAFSWVFGFGGPFEHTIIQGPIPFKYRIKKIVIPPVLTGVDSLRYYFLVGRSANIGPSIINTDDNVLGKYGSMPYISPPACSAPITVSFSYLVDEKNTYLKVYLNNLAWLWFTVYALVTIEEVE